LKGYDNKYIRGENSSIAVDWTMYLDYFDLV
jgi:hypothetical protein